jgi:hypothetical protein
MSFLVVKHSILKNSQSVFLTSKFDNGWSKRGGKYGRGNMHTWERSDVVGTSVDNMEKETTWET